jgi:hypothetical protein
MKLFLPIIFLTFFIHSGCSQTIVKNKTENKVDTYEDIVDPIEKMPFMIERENVYSEIPDSLGKNLLGLAGLRLYVSDKGIIKNFELVKLSLEKNGTSFIEYQRKNFGSFNIESYPADIQKYYPFLADNVNMLKVKKVAGVVPRPVILNLLVRFK